MPAALIFTTASFGFGCGTGKSTSSITSGPPVCLICMAFIFSRDDPGGLKDPRSTTIVRKVNPQLASNHLLQPKSQLSEPPVCANLFFVMSYGRQPQDTHISNCSAANISRGSP